MIARHRFRSVCSLAVFALLSSPACMDLDEDVETEDSIDAVVGGVPVVDYPSTGGLLRGATADRGFMQCTGTLVGCDTFITAAHCVCEDPQICNRPIPPDELFVFFQNAGSYPVSSVAIESNYQFPQFGDIAVVRLAEPVVGIKPIPIIREDPAVNAAMTIVGFGLSRKGGANDAGIKREGALQRTACNNFSDASHLCFSFGQSPTVSCSGDSGGPNFLDIGGTRHLAGVVSGGGTANSCTAGQKFATNVSRFSTFIDTNSGELGGTCGALPTASDPSTVIMTGEGTTGGVDYTIEVPPLTTELRVAGNGFFGGIALYVKEGSPATPQDFDCEASGSQATSCTVISPAAGTWHVNVLTSNTFQVAATALGGGPSGEPDVYEANTDELLQVTPEQGVLANDISTLELGLTAEIVDFPANGQINLGPAGDFTYLASPGYVGPDSFTYVVKDGPYSSAPVTVTLGVDEGGCGCASTGSRGEGAFLALFIGLLAFRSRRRRRQ